jgi:hypothetical protein
VTPDELEVLKSIDTSLRSIAQSLRTATGTQARARVLHDDQGKIVITRADYQNPAPSSPWPGGKAEPRPSSPQDEVPGFRRR